MASKRKLNEPKESSSKKEKKNDQITEENKQIAPVEEKKIELSANTEPKTHKPSYGMVLSIGSGDMGQLGLGIGARERKFPAIVKGLLGEDIIDIAVGAMHTLALTSEGRIYSWGNNDSSVLGRPSIDEDWDYNPHLVDTLKDKKVVQIKSGCCHSIALTSEGEVYAWGHYKDIGGNLGFSKDVPVATTPVLMDNFIVNGKHLKAIRISAGESIGLALLEDGTVMQWGDINFGKKVSERRKQDRLIPSAVQFYSASKSIKKADSMIVDVFAGGNSCFALAKSGCLWVWGPNNYGQAGIPRKKKELAIVNPTPIEALPKTVKEVAAGAHHTIVLTTDHRVFSFGRGHYNRLGHGDGQETDVPREIKTLSPGQLPDNDYVITVGAGEAHGMAATAQGKLYCWGFGDLLQLGNGEMKDEPVPRLVVSQQLTELKRQVFKVGGGSQHSAIIARDSNQS